MDVCRQELLDINKLDTLGIFARQFLAGDTPTCHGDDDRLQACPKVSTALAYQCLAGCRCDMDSGDMDSGFSDNEVP